MSLQTLLPLLGAIGAVASCPIASDTNMVYSIVDGVGPASKIWVQDFLWWWKQADSSINYQSLTAAQIQQCNLQEYPNLKLFLNPGGDTFNQLTDLQQAGRDNILNYIKAGGGYVGFCAGGYLAAKDYYWETMFEDAAYMRKYGAAPTLGAFPYSLEGSITDITDEQFGNPERNGVLYRLVNVSNGHKMLYYGGSTFGWNMAPDVSSDPDVEILTYYTDFYGYLSYNLPAVWKYKKNMLLTSVHPEADNCTTVDCPAAGTIPTENILQNRAWLATHLNSVAGTDFHVPSTTLAPSFDTKPPHSKYPLPGCYNGGAPRTPPILFCDDFNAPAGVVPSGLWNWERENTLYSSPSPWNTTYTDFYGASPEGNGYAVASIDAQVNYWASISTFPVSTPTGSSLSFKWMGDATYTVQYTVDGGKSWTNLAVPRPSKTWSDQSFPLPAASSLQVRFNCGNKGLCALDAVFISTPTNSTQAMDSMLV